MKKLTIITAILLMAKIVSAQINIVDTSFNSESLQQTKMVDVFLPPGYEENPDLYYPVIYVLHGWGGNQNTGNNYINTAYSLINSGTIDPVIMVCADNYTGPFGGSYYVNSELWGDYETYMVNDLPNWIESTFRAMPGRNYRGLFGMSMGGYGAFRYGILYKDHYRALTSCAGLINFSDDYAFSQNIQMVLQENAGPPYFYDFNSTGLFTKGQFLMCGAFAPNQNTPQQYINPAILEFSLDELGNPIDTVISKFQAFDIVYMISQLSPEDDLGIYFGCGSQDEWFLYPGTLAVKDSLELYGIPYEFYDHAGGHSMPNEFRQNAFLFLDSLLSPAAPINSSCLPEGITFTTQAEIDNFQVNHPWCNEIEGNVFIVGVDITNLDGLQVLT